FDVSAGVRPKQVSKGTITIADKNPTTPEKPKAIKFNAPVITVAPPAAPTINAVVPTVTVPTVTPPTVTEPDLPPTISFTVSNPTITVPNLTAPSVAPISPPGTGNGDGTWIQKSGSVGVFHQVNVDGGKIDVNLNGSSFDMHIDGSKLVGEDSYNHSLTYYDTINGTPTNATSVTASGATTAPPLTFSMLGNTSYAAMKLVGGQKIDIDNTNINFTGTGPSSNDRWLFHTDGHNDYGDSTWVIGNGSNININGTKLIMYTAQYHGGAPTAGNVGFVNNGNITTSATGSSNYIWVTMAAGDYSGPNTGRTMYFDNRASGNITLNGTKDVFAVIDSESETYYSTPNGGFTVINDGKINLAGKEQTGITFGRDYPISEILLNKPITITGEKSTGIYFNHDIDLLGGQSRNKDTSNNVVTDISTSSTTTKKSILNVDITAGKQNSGLFFDADGKTFDVANSTINLSSADGSNAGIFVQNGTLNLNNSGNNNVNLIGGKDNVGIYVDNSGAGSKVATLNAEGKVNITGGTGGIGILSVGNPSTKVTATNKGTVTVSAPDNTGMVAAEKNGVAGEINQEGTVLVNTTKAIGVAATGAGSIANIKNGSKTTAGETTGKAGSAAGASGLYAADGGKVVSLSGATINSANGGIGAYASGATTGGTIDFNGSTINTNIRGLSFMADGKGTINFSGTTTGNIADYGTVFYLPPVNTPSSVTDTTNFNSTSSIVLAFTTMIQNHFSNLGNLHLNMTDKSNMVVTSYVSGNASDLTFNESTAFGSAGTPIISGNYKAFLLDKSNITVDVDSDLDSSSSGTAAAFRKLALSSSTITNNKNITGTESGLVAMAQEDITTGGWVNLKNSSGATINLSGDKSVAMYASNGKITNDGSITVGDKGVAIYGHNNGYGDTEISNTGKITVGSQSTGIYAKAYTSKDVKNSSSGVIEINGSQSSAMAFVPDALTGVSTVFENEGKILDNNSGSNNTGMFAKVAANNKLYTTKNSGTITLGDSSALSNPSVGMYTNATSAGTNQLTNTGKITVGNNGIGMYGFEEDTTGDVTAGNGGIGLYSQGGAVNIGSGSTTPKITVGDTNATAVFTTGNGQTVTSTNADYSIGSNSYGFINTGSGNTLNISGGSGTLADNGVFIYSNDTTGNITNSTKITSTGSKGYNYGVFSAGTVNNSGDITLTNGVGNVGVYAANNGNITNSGNITLGASTSADRSVGAIANVGTVNNTGNIVVNGQYGIGTYSSGSGSTVNNSGDITLTGDETIGNYGVAGSNINLNSGTVALTGNKSTGYYLDAGTGSTIASGAKINVTGEEANGVYANNGSTLTYSGDTTVDGDAAYGLIVDGNSNVNATGGTLTVKGTSGINGTSSAANTNRGSAALVVTSGSNLSGGGLDATADVTGENSVGVYSAGSLAMNSANISAYDSAVNFFTDGGTISVGNNGGTSTTLTGTGNNQGA
ncbi:beta strand repeat-containing protein, partial [Fusobacterium animalis]|uniref:beta strand repeat-containing protein n=1 Tax=Fusobacterium animalis TaxID=76859 RepID=UPI0034DFA4D6